MNVVGWMYSCMAWVDGRMGRIWTDVWPWDGWLGGWDGWMTVGWMAVGWMDGWMVVGWMDGRGMDGWMDGSGATAGRGGSTLDVDGVSVRLVPPCRERVSEPVHGDRSGIPAPLGGQGHSPLATADTQRSGLRDTGDNIRHEAKTLDGSFVLS